MFIVGIKVDKTTHPAMLKCTNACSMCYNSPLETPRFLDNLQEKEMQGSEWVLSLLLSQSHYDVFV